MILLPLALWHPYLICPPFWTAAAVGFRRQCQWVTGVFRPSLPSTQELAPRQVPGSVFFSCCPLILPHCQSVPTRFSLSSLPEPSSVTFFSFSVSHVASARLSRGRFSFHPVLYSYLRPLVLLPPVSSQLSAFAALYLHLPFCTSPSVFVALPLASMYLYHTISRSSAVPVPPLSSVYLYCIVRGLVCRVVAWRNLIWVPGSFRLPFSYLSHILI